MVRAFVAVDISQGARDALSEAAERLQRQALSSVRWVRSEGIHLTLKFLGEVDSALVDRILGALEPAARGTGPFSLGLSELGAFPSADSPRVVWVGLKGDLSSLGELQVRIDRQLHADLGFAPEGRSFSPHLTLGRLRQGASGAERRRVAGAMSQVTLSTDVSWDAREVRLIRSTLMPSGAIYDVLGSVPL